MSGGKSLLRSSSYSSMDSAASKWKSATVRASHSDPFPFLEREASARQLEAWEPPRWLPSGKRRRGYYWMLVSVFVGLLWFVDWEVVSKQQRQQEDYVETGSGKSVTESRRQAAVLDHYEGERSFDDVVIMEDDEKHQSDYYECDYSIFSEYFVVQHDLPPPTRSASSTSPVPFSFACLRDLIGQHPKDLHLRTTYVRKLYAHSLQGAASKRTVDHPQTLIYRCTFGSGGLGDRFWGAALTLYLALALNVPMAIHFQQPLPLDAYVEPVGPELPTMKTFLQQYPPRWLHEYENPPENPTFDWLEFARRELLQWEVDKEEGVSPYQWKWPWQWDWQDERSVARHFLNKKTLVNEKLATVNLQEYFFGSSKHRKRVGLLQMRQPPLIARNSQAPVFSNPQVLEMQQRYLLHDLNMEDFMKIFLNLYVRKASPYLRELEAPFLSSGDSVVGVQMRLGGSQNVTTAASDTSWEDPRRYFHGDPVACFATEAQRQCALLTEEESAGAKGARVPRPPRQGRPKRQPWRQARQQQPGRQARQQQPGRQARQQQPGRQAKQEEGGEAPLAPQAQRRLESQRELKAQGPKRGETKQCRVLVSSDSSQAVNRLERELQQSGIAVWQVPGEITHIDKVVFSDEEANQRQAHARAFVDWHLLAYHSDRLLVSRSGFGELAAMASRNQAWHYDNHETSCKFASFEEAMAMWHQRREGGVRKTL